VRCKDLAQLPLCLLTPNMQNRQIVNSAFRRESVTPFVVVETDSMSALLAHVRHAGLTVWRPGVCWMYPVRRRVW